MIKVPFEGLPEGAGGVVFAPLIEVGGADEMLGAWVEAKALDAGPLGLTPITPKVFGVIYPRLDHAETLALHNHMQGCHQMRVSVRSKGFQIRFSK